MWNQPNISLVWLLFKFGLYESILSLLLIHEIANNKSDISNMNGNLSQIDLVFPKF